MTVLGKNWDAKFCSLEDDESSTHALRDGYVAKG